MPRARLTVALLALLVVAPLGALGWLGVRVVADRQTLVGHELDAQVAGRLDDLAGRVEGWLQALERDLMPRAEEALSLAPRDPEAFRFAKARWPDVGHAFVLELDAGDAPDDGLVFPPPGDAPRSAEETQALEVFAPLWRGGVLASRVSATAADDSTKGLTTRQTGWLTWFHGDGLTLWLWLAEPGDAELDRPARLVALELPRVGLLANLVGALPDTLPDRGTADSASFPEPVELAGAASGPDAGRDAMAREEAAPYLAVLADASGRPVYQWGRYAPAPGEPARAVRALAEPLGAWTLRWYAAPSQAPALVAEGLAWTLGGGLGALALVLMALGVWLVRERSREIRLARTRVGFVQNVSHELKTPLTNLQLYAALLEDAVDELEDALDVAGGLDPDPGRPDAATPGGRALGRARKHLSVLDRESQRLGRLIGNVLAFAREREGRLAIRALPIAPDAAVDAALEPFRPALEAKGIAVVRDAGAGAGALALDADAVGQVVANLVGNVLKYAPSSPEVRVATRRVPGSGGRPEVLELTVADAGPGVPAGDRARIFEPFERGGRDRLADVAGTGLGLAIARQLAQLHGGDLVLAPSGAGATFVATFASEAATPQIEAAARASDLRTGSREGASS